MDDALTSVFLDFFSGNRGEALDIVADRTDDPTVIRLRLTFRTGGLYCCAEPGCHFVPGWKRLRAIAADQGVSLPEPITLHLQGVIEAGAYFQHSGGASAGYEYATVYREAGEEEEH